jgi:hypothetical protein
MWSMESVLEEMTITQQGLRYALGRDSDGYAVLDTAAGGTTVVARFPLTAQGWFSARREFERLEQPPSATSPITMQSSVVPGSMNVRAAVILAGVTIGTTGLFPSYFSGVSLASHVDQLLPHLVYLLGWAVAGILLLTPRLARVGAVGAVGLSVMSFSFFVTDVGTAVSSSAQSGGPGLYLSLVGWALCAGGSFAALVSTHDATSRNSLHLHERLLIPGLIVVVGAAITFALPWDSYHLLAAATGQSESFTAGYAFSNPGAILIGELITMAAMVVLLGLALAWRPIVTGTALFVGAMVPLVAQLFSALLQPAPSLAQFGVSAAVASQDQVHLSAGYTPWFYLYCAAIGLLVIAGGWMVAKVNAHND